MKIQNLSDWLIAIAVIFCSAVLLAALAMALSGVFLGTPSRFVEVDFRDITGVGVNSEVRFAGAPAGRISGVRILTPAERQASAAPLSAVRVTLALTDAVPEIPADVTASISSDTILSDKFVVLDAGTPDAPPLATGAVIAGITPVPLDRLLRQADELVTALDSVLSGSSDASNIFTELRGLLNDTRSVLGEIQILVADAATLPGEVRPVLSDFRSVAGDAKSLIGDIRPGMKRTIASLEKASASLDRLATNGTQFLSSNEKNVAALISETRVTIQNAKIAATYARILAQSLTRNPAQLIWGTRRPPELPSKEEILKSPGPVKVDSSR